MITSASNAKVHRIRDLLEKSKVRRSMNAFVVEGIRMFREIPKDELIETYVSMSFHNSHPSIEGELVSDEVFAKLSDTRTPQGVLAVVRRRFWSLDNIISSMRTGGILILLESLQDPGNLGTVLRTGEGAGISGIIMDTQTADIYSPKVTRSTMGSIFRVPFLYVDNLKETALFLRKAGTVLYAADMRAKRSYSEIDYPSKCAFIIGNEGRGLSDEMRSSADELVKIPMCGRVESLNAAVSAALLMYDCRMKIGGFDEKQGFSDAKGFQC